MRFEGRELKEYAEPITTESLHTGKIYFALQFVDQEMLVPTLEPLIFLGKNLVGDERENLCFQNFESYCQGIRIDSAEEDERHFFEVAAPSGINHIFEYERALDVLMSCGLRRQKSR